MLKKGSKVSTLANTAPKALGIALELDRAGLDQLGQLAALQQHGQERRPRQRQRDVRILQHAAQDMTG